MPGRPTGRSDLTVGELRRRIEWVTGLLGDDMDPKEANRLQRLRVYARHRLGELQRSGGKRKPRARRAERAA